MSALFMKDSAINVNEETFCQVYNGGKEMKGREYMYFSLHGMWTADIGLASASQTFLWWANPAVPVNDNTQSVFPPDVHAVMDHGKRDVSRFPIATGIYYKKDYSEGVDISRYKNIPVPTSYMAEKSACIFCKFTFSAFNDKLTYVFQVSAD